MTFKHFIYLYMSEIKALFAYIIVLLKIIFKNLPNIIME